MSCLSQRSGRFTFKSGRGNSEIYLQQGSIRHAVFGSVEGEAAVAEIFRWRQGRFYFEEGIISQEQTVNRPCGAPVDRQSAKARRNTRAGQPLADLPEHR